VYAGIVRINDDPPRIGVVSIGKPVTFGLDSPTFECHILDFDRDIYHQVISVDLRIRIRSMIPFSGVDELKKQIAADCQTARDKITPILNSDGS